MNQEDDRGWGVVLEGDHAWPCAYGPKVERLLAGMGHVLLCKWLFYFKKIQPTFSA